MSIADRLPDDHDLRCSQAIVYLVVHDDGPLTVGDVAEQVTFLMSERTARRALVDLDDAGLVTTTPSTDDPRYRICDG